MRAALALATLLVSDLAIAAATPAASPATVQATAPGSLGGQLAQMVFGLLLVVGLIFFLAWALRRMQGATPKGGQVIEIVGSRAIGPRDRLLLVQVGKEQILIGHTPGSIEALHVMAEPVEVPVRAARRRQNLPSG